MQGLTLFDDEPEFHIAPEVEAGDAPEQQGNPAMFLVGFILLLAIMWFVRHNSSPALKSEVLGLNVFNVVAIGGLALVFILVGKFLTARFPVPGLTSLFAAV